MTSASPLRRELFQRRTRGPSPASRSAAPPPALRLAAAGSCRSGQRERSSDVNVTEVGRRCLGVRRPRPRPQGEATDEDRQPAEERLLLAGRAGRGSRRWRRASSAAGPARRAARRSAAAAGGPAGPARPPAAGRTARGGQLDAPAAARPAGGRSAATAAALSPRSARSRASTPAPARRRGATAGARPASRDGAAIVDGSGSAERGDRQIVLAGEAQPARLVDQDRQLGAGGQQLGHQRRGREDLLEVVEEQQRAGRRRNAARPSATDGRANLAHTERLRDGGGDEAGRRPGPAGRTRRPSAKSAASVGRRRQGQAGLADAAGAGQGQEADVAAAQQVADRGDLPLPADQRRHRRRQPGRPGRSRFGWSRERHRDEAGAVAGQGTGHGAVRSFAAENTVCVADRS